MPVQDPCDTKCMVIAAMTCSDNSTIQPRQVYHEQVRFPERTIGVVSASNSFVLHTFVQVIGLCMSGGGGGRRGGGGGRGGRGDVFISVHCYA